MASRCGTCGANTPDDATQCPTCGHINKHPSPSEWIETRKRFLEALKCYIPQCPNCGAYILTEDECDIFDEEGISGEGDLQLKPLDISVDVTIGRSFVFCYAHPLFEGRNFLGIQELFPLFRLLSRLSLG